MARLQSTLQFFDDHPLLMLSLSANDLCLSLLIESRDHEKLLASAHGALIPDENGHTGATFGPRWLEILQQS